jgi:hypothetical protein
MKQWELVDCIDPLEEDQDNPRIPIGSETQLRQELKRLEQRKRHGVAMLDSPEGNTLSFTIGGGPFASIGWHPPTGQERYRGNKEGVPARPVAEHPVQSWGEGIPTDIEPEALFPVEQAVEAIVYFYNTHQLPKWITWREWDPASLQWKVTPAEAIPRPVAASSCEQRA